MQLISISDLKSNSTNIVTYTRVTTKNVDEVGIFCIKDKKAAGFKAKVEWFRNKLNAGLQIIIATDNNGKQLGFIEYIPSESAWRPISAKNYYFIHCIAVFAKKSRSKGIASKLLDICFADAQEKNMSGVCVMASDGPWMANKKLFVMNGMEVCDEKGRFELLYKTFKDQGTPQFLNWESAHDKFQGWHLVYSDQCPWHYKSVQDLTKCALENGIELKVKKIESPLDAQHAPSGFGTFSLLHNGELLADHYISKTRFLNILKKELS